MIVLVNSNFSNKVLCVKNVSCFCIKHKNTIQYLYMKRNIIFGGVVVLILFFVSYYIFLFKSNNPKENVIFDDSQENINLDTPNNLKKSYQFLDQIKQKYNLEFANFSILENDFGDKNINPDTLEISGLLNDGPLGRISEFGTDGDWYIINATDGGTVYGSTEILINKEIGITCRIGDKLEKDSGYEKVNLRELSELSKDDPIFDHVRRKWFISCFDLN